MGNSREEAASRTATMTSPVAARAVITCPSLGLSEAHRVIWTNSDQDRCVVIACHQDHLKAPRKLLFTALDNLVGTPDLTFTTAVPDPRALMDDKALAKAYPPFTEGGASFPVSYRNHWGELIRPIHARSAEVWKGELSLHGLIHDIFGPEVKGLWRIYETLYRFWAAGSRYRAVLPATDKSGARGQRRAGRVGTPLGRKTLAVADAGAANNNFIMTPEAIEQVQTAWRRLVKPNRGPRKAYRLFLAAFYVERWEGEGDSAKPIILRRGKRPSFRQFYEHGRSQNRRESAFRKMLGEGVFALLARAFEGTPSEKPFSTGNDGEIDASSGDTYLKSAFDRLRDVGPCKVILVVCAESGYIHGGLPCWRVTKRRSSLRFSSRRPTRLSIAPGTASRSRKKIGYPRCSHSLWPTTEKPTASPFASTSWGLECSIVYVRVRRGDDKPKVEQAIHRTHKHDQPGSTHGRLQRRGEVHPAKLAAYNIHEFTADFIEAILWANNHQLVPKLARRFPDLDVPPRTRAEALKYSMVAGTHTDHAYHAHELLVALCPEYPAAVTRDAVFLVVRRRGNAGDEILLTQFPFRPPASIWIQWSEEVARTGHRLHKRVRVKAFDLSAVFYLDPQLGMIQLDLVSGKCGLEANCGAGGRRSTCHMGHH